MSNPEYIITTEEMEFPEKNKGRELRRDRDEAKAKRKQKIANQVYDGGFYAVHGYYRKGKIHCSCPLCRAKTNAKTMKPADITAHRYKKNYTHADRKRIDRMIFGLTDFIGAAI